MPKPKHSRRPIKQKKPAPPTVAAQARAASTQPSAQTSYSVPAKNSAAPVAASSSFLLPDIAVEIKTIGVVTGIIIVVLIILAIVL